MCWPLQSLFTILIGFVLLFTAPPARAELEADLQKPYELHVVLSIAEHRALTPIFQDKVEHQLRGHLQLTFGKLANVKILRTHPLLAAVRTKGLQQTLDGWDDLSPIKTHFVLIDFVSGRYEIQARQHDGVTGLSSPVVRRDTTSDALLVALKAALLVDRDFGLAGTVVRGENDKVRVALQGGGLGVPLHHWLKAGDVFAVARVTSAGDRLRATRLDWTILQALEEPNQGICLCRFATRFAQNELIEGVNILGYRCLQLATTSAPLRLRLLEEDEKAAVPLPGVQVHVSRADFDGPDALRLASGPDGLVLTEQPFSGVAFVTLFSGVRARARFPVAIVDESTIVCRVRANPEADAQAQLELSRDRWVRRIYDLLLAAVNRVQTLNQRLSSARPDALAIARAGLEGLKEDIDNLQLEHDQLRDAGKGKLDLSEGEQRLEELRLHRAKLTHFVDNFERVLQKENSAEAKALRTRLERGPLLEAQGEIDEAIKLYRQILEESPDQPNVRSHLQALAQAWEIKNNPAHLEARNFIYNEWSRPLDTAGLQALLPRARQALEVFQKAGDRLSVRKLVLAELTHVAALSKRLEVVRQRESEDNGTEARTIGQLAEALAGLHRDAVAYARQGRGPAP